MSPPELVKADALQRIESEVPATRADDPMALLTMAVQRGADVETLERLAVLREKFMAEQAKNAFFAALAAFQAECPVLIRNRAGHENRYNYAPLEKIVRDVTPYLNKHGFSHQEDGVVTEGWVEAIVTVTHRLGHKEEKRFKVPTESKAGMSLQQKYGAAMTYATRYAFCAAFGIRTADRDTDCPPAEESITKLKADLWTVLAPVRGTEKNWNMARQWLVDEMCLDPDISISQLDAVGLRATIDAARKKLEAMR